MYDKELQNILSWLLQGDFIQCIFIYFSDPKIMGHSGNVFLSQLKDLSSLSLLQVTPALFHFHFKLVFQNKGTNLLTDTVNF